MSIQILYGNEYLTVDDAGRIGRGPPAKVTPSDSWRVVSAIERNNFGRAVRFYSLQEILADPASIPWQFKNGKQRTFINDCDHGTRREWCSPTHRAMRA